MSEQRRSFTVTAIGVVRRAGLPDVATIAPAEPFDPCAESLIEIYPEWAAGLAGIEGFSHLAVVLYLDSFAPRRADEPFAYRLPWLGATRDVGLFGTSSPYRPNPLVIRYPRLLGRSHNVLRVSGLSIGADTAVLDVLGQSSSDRACRGFSPRGPGSASCEHEHDATRGDTTCAGTGMNAGGAVPAPQVGRLHRVLVAGVGNLLRGDDGFGVEVARRLLAAPPCLAGVTATVIETGIGGMHLVQELMSGYDALIILDAVERAAAPDTLFLLEPERTDTASWSAETRRDFFADTHYAEPSHALALAGAIGVLPPRVLIVGCQVATVDDLLEGLTPAVARAVEALLPRLPGIIADILRDESARAAPPVP